MLGVLASRQSMWSSKGVPSAAGQICAGLVTTMAAKALGAGRVAVVDMNQANLEVQGFHTASAKCLHTRDVVY